MPNVAYTYYSLNAINWPAPGVAVGPGVTSCAFAPTNALPGLGTPQAVPWPALANAALVTGVYPGPLALDQAEQAWRLNALLTAAGTDGMGNLATTAVFALADPTEKGVLAYHMGSTLTGVLAIALGTVPAPWNFMHLSRWLAALPGTVVFAAPAQPDYLSMSIPGPTIQVWEAKGRTGGAVPGTLRAAFTQTQAIATVGGAPPNGCVAVLGRAAGGQWQLHVTDPGENTFADLSPRAQDSIFVEYYRPWRQLLQAETKRASEVKYADATFTTVPFQPADVAVGLDQRVIALLDDAQSGQMAPGDLSAALQKVLTPGYQNAEGPRFVNPNGLYVEIGDIWKNR